MGHISASRIASSDHRKWLLFASASAAALTLGASPAWSANLCGSGSATFNPTTYTARTEIDCEGDPSSTPTLSIVTDGGTALQTDSIVAGGDPGQAGVITIGVAGQTTGPTVNMVSGDERLTSGAGGIGTVNIVGGAQVTGNFIVAGWYGNGFGTVNVSGANTQLNLGTAVDLGLVDNAKGTVNVTDGAKMSVNGQIWAGHFGNGQGTINVDGAASALTSTADLTFGGENGGSVNTQGAMTVSDGGSVQAERIHIGSFGAGTVTVTGNGSVLQSGSYFGIGENQTNGQQAQGTLNVADGGVARAGADGLGTISVGTQGIGTVVMGSLTDAATTSSGTVQAGNLALGDYGTLVFSHDQTSADPAQFASTVTGTGAIKSFAGYTLLTGDLSGFTGQTIVSGGNLALGTAFGGAVEIDSGGIFTVTDTGTFTGTLNNSGIFAVDTSSARTLDSTGFSGSGAFEKDGSGIVTLVGTNSATGGVIVNSGVLTGTTAAIGTGSLNIHGGTLSVTDGLALQQAALVDGSGATLAAPSVDVGSGAGAGTLALANGGTVGVAGGTGVLNVGQGGQGTLILGGLDTPAAGAGTIDATSLALGSGGTLAFNHNQTSANPYQFGTTLTGTGTMKSLSGYTMLTGDLSGFAGQTVVSGGNLVLATNFAGPVQITSGGIFTLSDTGTFTGTLDNEGTFAIDTSLDKTLDAGGFNGSGAFEKDGSGSVTLTGTNGATGGIVVNAGQLAGASAAIGSGNLTVHGGTLAVSDPLVLSQTAVVDGMGATLSAPSVDIEGSSDHAVLALANGGKVRVNGGAGVLNVGMNGGHGVLVLGGVDAPSAMAGVIDATSVALGDNGEIDFNHQGTAANPYDFTTKVTGTGHLESYAGVTRLAGDLSGFTGLTEVDGGNLILATTLSAPVRVNAGGTFTLTDEGNLTGTLTNYGTLGIDSALDKTIDTSGFLDTAGLLKDGSGILTLTGTNSSTGGLTINGGKVATGVLSLGAGTITVNQGGALSLTDTTDVSLAQTLAGNGAITKDAVGTLAYTGDGSAFAGDFRVNSGALRIVGALGGSVTIASGATLTGTGTIGDLDVLAGGTLAPGNTNSQLNIKGDANFAAGSTYLVGISGTPANDSTYVYGAAKLNGATLKVVALSQSFNPGTKFQILTADGGVDGTFTGPVYTAMPFMNFGLSYDANDVYLNVNKPLTFQSVAQTRNQRAVATAANVLGYGNAIYDQIVVSPDADTARAAFDSLSGEIHASARVAVVEDSRLIRDAISSRLATARGDGIWGQGLYNWGTSKAFEGSASVKRDTKGGLIGVDKGLGDDETVRVGLVGGYTETKLNAQARASSGQVRTIHADVYASGKAGPLVISAGVGYGRVKYDLSRSVAFLNFSDKDISRYHGTLIHGFGDVSVPVTFGDGTIAPYANIAYVHTSSDNFVENGGSSALQGKDTGKGTGLSRIGLRLSTPTDKMFSLRVDAGWQHAFGSTNPTTHLAFYSGGLSYDVAGAAVSRNAAVVSAEAVIQATPKLQLSAGYDGSLRGTERDNAVKARLSYAF